MFVSNMDLDTLKCALIQGKSQIYENEVSDSNLVSKVNVQSIYKNYN